MESASSSPRCSAEVVLESSDAFLRLCCFGPDFESVFDRAQLFLLSHSEYTCILFEVQTPGRVQKLESDGK